MFLSEIEELFDAIDRWGGTFFHPNSTQRSAKISNIWQENMRDSDTQLILEYFLFYDYDCFCRFDALSELCKMSRKLPLKMSQYVAALLTDDICKDLQNNIMEGILPCNFLHSKEAIDRYSKKDRWRDRLWNYVWDHPEIIGESGVTVPGTFFDISNSTLVMPHLVISFYISDGTWNEKTSFSLHDEKTRARSWEALEILYEEFLLNKHTQNQALQYAVDAWASTHNMCDPLVEKIEQKLLKLPDISISEAHKLFEEMCPKLCTNQRHLAHFKNKLWILRSENFPTIRKKKSMQRNVHPFDISLNDAVVTSIYITKQKMPILEIYHELDEESGEVTWQFHAGNGDFGVCRVEPIWRDARA